jgi:DNA-binding beta-propeller fold protein YncE
LVKVLGGWRLVTLTSLVALATMLVLSAIAPPAARAATPSLYVVNGQNRSLSAYTLSANGTPIPVAGSPYSVGIAPGGVAMTPDAEHVYVTNGESKTLSAFTVGPGGSLTPVPGAPFTTGYGPWGVAVSPDGTLLYETNSSGNTVWGYSVAADGGLTVVPGSPFFHAGNRGANGIAISPDGSHLYASTMGGDLVAFSIAADGGLSELPGSPYAVGISTRGLSVTPDGKHLYVAITSEGGIGAFSIGDDGGLTPLPGSPLDAEGSPLSVAVNPQGTHLYMAHVGGKNNVWAWSIGPAGELTPVPGTPFPTGGIRGNGLAFSPSGKRLYQTNSQSSNVTVFSVAASGALSPIAGSPFATSFGPLQLVVSPDQGPTAAFSSIAVPAGNPYPFDASASSDPDGTVASYEWDFGDGEAATTASPTHGHVYDSPGEYTVTLTVADNAGCSLDRVYTGQTVGCNGSPLARTSHQVTVAPGVPLTVSADGTGSGSVVSSPAGIDCPADCAYFFEHGTEVTLAASPAPGSSFSGWSGACSGTGECEVTVDAATEVAASFAEIPKPPPPPPPPPPPNHTLTVGLAGSGSVVGDVGGASGGLLCPPACSQAFAAGTEVTLTPSAAPGSRFAGWSGGGCTGTGPCQLALGTDTTVTGSFEKLPPIRARLRIGQVQPRTTRAGLRLAVVGTIAPQASGAVTVTVSARKDGRRLTASRLARIADGHWHARLVLPRADRSGGAPIRIVARFKGSSDVSGGQTGIPLRLR